MQFEVWYLFFFFFLRNQSRILFNQQKNYCQTIQEGQHHYGCLPIKSGVQHNALLIWLVYQPQHYPFDVQEKSTRTDLQSQNVGILNNMSKRCQTRRASLNSLRQLITVLESPSNTTLCSPISNAKEIALLHSKASTSSTVGGSVILFQESSKNLSCRISYHYSNTSRRGVLEKLVAFVWGYHRDK